MASIITLIDTIISCVRADTAIAAWADSVYSTTLKIADGWDSRREPGQNDCPLVIVSPDIKSTGLLNTSKEHSVYIGCLVYDSEIDTSVDGVVKFLNWRRAEELRGLVFSAAVAAVQDDIHMDDSTSRWLFEEQYPFASSNMGLTLTQPKVLTGNPLTFFD